MSWELESYVVVIGKEGGIWKEIKLPYCSGRLLVLYFCLWNRIVVAGGVWPLKFRVALIPQFGLGSRMGSLPPVLFHLVWQLLKNLLIPEMGNSHRFGICNVQHYTGSETINHFTHMSAASKHPTFVVHSLTTLIVKMLYSFLVTTLINNNNVSQLYKCTFGATMHKHT